jgi:hypothetical protein
VRPTVSFGVRQKKKCGLQLQKSSVMIKETNMNLQRKRKQIKHEGLCREKEKKSDGGGAVLKMTMNSILLIRSSRVVLRCHVTNIIVTFSDPVLFFNSLNETDLLSKV